MRASLTPPHTTPTPPSSLLVAARNAYRVWPLAQERLRPFAALPADRRPHCTALAGAIRMLALCLVPEPEANGG